jgi:Uma2 family endonuclease
VGQRSDGESEYDLRMSVEAIDANITQVLTLDGLAVMNSTDTHGYRYELSPEGALSVMPPPDVVHAFIATRIMAWLLAAGYKANQVAQAIGVRVPGPDGRDGGRIPDLVVWSTPPVRTAPIWVENTGIAVVMEIISRSSRPTDMTVKLEEYARAGMPRYWIVDRDRATTVTMYELNGDAYLVRNRIPLDRLLDTPPSDYLG